MQQLEFFLQNFDFRFDFLQGKFIHHHEAGQIFLNYFHLFDGIVCHVYRPSGAKEYGKRMSFYYSLFPIPLSNCLKRVS
ncbi:hypothetical protein D3C81_2039130 [compost metagenome]